MFKKYSSVLITIFVIFVIMVALYKEDKSKMHINELVNMHPFSTYNIKQINSNVRKYRSFPDTGRLGDFYTCLKSYKPESKGAKSEGEATGYVELEIGRYLLWLNVGNNTAAYEVNFKKHDNKNILWKTRFSFDCDFNLLNRTSEINNIDLFKRFDAKTSYKNLYISNPNIGKIKTKGKLGDFYQCIGKRKLWNYKNNQKEQGMVKIELDGFILHLGTRGQKIINVMVEQYGKKRETELLSKMYAVDCELSLLNS